jgi:hypothetical protein
MFSASESLHVGVVGLWASRTLEMVEISTNSSGRNTERDIETPGRVSRQYALAGYGVPPAAETLPRRFT